MTAVPSGLRLHPQVLLRSRATRGDAAAFAAVYERYHQALYRYCRSILHHEEDAQDALQNTMARAFAALQAEHRDFDLRPWLFRIAHNEAISMLRQRRVMAEFDDQRSPSADVEDRIAVREELRLLQLDLADLPERQRGALVLRELCGLSYVDIGAVLDLSPVAVKHTIFDARKSLFSSREGRAFACEDVRRKLSDGDGRVLRGRAVRAHVRSCAGCRRFQADLAQRPRALRMLAPPLPGTGAAMLLSQLLGSTAAKLLACAVLVAGGTTLDVETRHMRDRAPAADRDRASLPLPQAAPAMSASPAVASLRIPSVVPQLSTARLAPRERSNRPAPADTPVSDSISLPRRVPQKADHGAPAVPITARDAGLATELAEGEQGGDRASDAPAATTHQAEPAEAGSRGNGSNRGNADGRGNGADRGKAEGRANRSNRGNAESRGNGADGSPGKAESAGDATARRVSGAPGAAAKMGEASSPPVADAPADPGPPAGAGAASGEPPAKGRDGTPPAASAHEPPGNGPKAPPGHAEPAAGG